MIPAVFAAAHCVQLKETGSGDPLVRRDRIRGDRFCSSFEEARALLTWELPLEQRCPTQVRLQRLSSASYTMPSASSSLAPVPALHSFPSSTLALFSFDGLGLNCTRYAYGDTEPVPAGDALDPSVMEYRS
jgi:hypothetical protein